MKEITRIHIAKISYDIELPAKRVLEKYLHALETYSNDSDVVEDIEVRITELLAERGVMHNNVITLSDVEAVKSQLGDPEEFAEEGDIALGSTLHDNEMSARRLYRNTDNAILGGVLSGVAAFFKINPVWIRLAFVILLIPSFGTAILIYILMWIIIPPARTAAEKLQLRGIAPTATSIRELNIEESELRLNERSARRKRFFAGVIGTLALLAGLVFAGALIALVVAVTIFGYNGDGLNNYTSWPILLTIALFLLVLASLFFGIISYAGYSSKINKRIITSLIIIAAAGIFTAIGAVTYVANQAWQRDEYIRSLMKEQTITTKDQLTNASKLIINAPDVNVQYLQSDTQKIEFVGLPGPIPTITKEGTVVTVKYAPKMEVKNHRTTPRLTIYGPVVPEIQATAMRLNSTLDADTLTINTSNSLTLNGSIQNLHATVNKNSFLDATQATISTVDVKVGVSAQVEFGTIRSLKIALPDTCPVRSAHDRTVVTLAGIIEGSMIVNDQLQKTTAYKNDCSAIYVGDARQSDRDDEPYL